MEQEERRALPKISFIAPVYGVEKYLEHFIESILGQTFSDFELILIDDGSPDRSPEICDYYAERDTRVKVIHQNNGGVSAARNTGLDAASGEYAYIVDSDDWLEPTAAEILYKDAKKTGADVVMSDCVQQYENGNKLRMRQFSQPFYTDEIGTIQRIQQYILCQKYSPYYSTLSSSGYAAPWGKFIKMSVIKENMLRFDPYVKGIFDDGLFSLNLLEHIKTFYYNGKHTYNYRMMTSSVSRGFKNNAIELLSNSFQKIDEFIVENEKEAELRYPFYAHVCRFFIFRLDSYFFNEKNTKSNEELKKELINTIDSKYFKESIERVKMNDLSGQYQMAIKLARIKSYKGLRLFVNIRRLYLKAKRR